MLSPCLGEETEQPPKSAIKGRSHVGPGVLLVPHEFWNPRFVYRIAMSFVRVFLCGTLRLFVLRMFVTQANLVYIESPRTARAR